MKTDNSIKEKHSPLPWTFDKDLNMIKTNQPFEICSMNKHALDRVNEVNGKHIVKCVNGYAGLEEDKEALIKVVAGHENTINNLSELNVVLVDALKDMVNSYEKERGLLHIEDLHQSYYKAKAALSKAGFIN